MRNEEESVCSRCNILISGKIIKEMPGSVASGTHCIKIGVECVGYVIMQQLVSYNVSLRSGR